MDRLKEEGSKLLSKAEVLRGHKVVHVEEVKDFLDFLDSEGLVVVPKEESFEISNAARAKIEQLGYYANGQVRCTADDFAEIYKVVISHKEQ